jgi:hypothetical protein
VWQSTENNKMRGTSQLGFLDRVLVAVMIVLNAVLWNALDLCAVGPAVGDRRSRSIRSPSSRLQCQRRNGAWFNSASVHVAAGLHSNPHNLKQFICRYNFYPMTTFVCRLLGFLLGVGVRIFTTVISSRPNK